MENIVSGVEQDGGDLRDGVSVTVSTTARLHLGFMDPSGRGERALGSLGLSLDWPQTRLTLSRAAESRATGPDSARAALLLDTLSAEAGIDGKFSIHVDRAIPAHAGLGSGTQLALAVGAAFAKLTGRPFSPAQAAIALGRGKRSGIGIGAFQTGGVLVDGGHGPGTNIPPIIARLPFPDDWRVVLILDPEAVGVHGNEEKDAFRDLPAFPKEQTAELCRRLVMGTLSALAAANLFDFSAEVRHLQHRMGDYYAAVQGGRFASAAVEDAIRLIEVCGVVGTGQSSWGPTGFAFVGSDAEAKKLLDDVTPRAAPHLNFEIARGLNRGALIERHG